MIEYPTFAVNVPNPTSTGSRTTKARYALDTGNTASHLPERQSIQQDFTLRRVNDSTVILFARDMFDIFH